MYIPSQNIHWLFGTSMQIIATFVGLLAAGFFFFHDRLEKEMEKDETLREISDEIRKQYFRRFKMLFGITAASLITGFGLLYMAASGIVWHVEIIVTIVGLLHMFNLILAGWFFIFIINPDIIHKTAQKLVRENSTLFNQSSGNGISQGAFIDKFWALEKILRAIAAKKELGIQHGESIPFAQLIQELHDKGIVNNEQLKELNQISKARNISVHGKVSNIESDLGNSAEKLNRELSGTSEPGP